MPGTSNHSQHLSGDHTLPAEDDTLPNIDTTMDSTDRHSASSNDDDTDVSDDHMGPLLSAFLQTSNTTVPEDELLQHILRRAATGRAVTSTFDITDPVARILLQSWWERSKNLAAHPTTDMLKDACQAYVNDDSGFWNSFHPDEQDDANVGIHEEEDIKVSVAIADLFRLRATTFPSHIQQHWIRSR